MSDPVAVRNYHALKKKSYAVKFDLDGKDYTAVENIGTGAYGVVCSAVHNKSKDKVAIKKIPSIFEQPIIALRTFREIKILKHFKHDNVIAIREILHPGNVESFKDVYIVLDLMESDLHRIIHSKQELSEEHVRFFLYQILRGLKYVHSAKVVHRDLKPSNLLVNGNCDLKIGDFGMARGLLTSMDEYSMMMTQYVATRWYRAPELMILPKETYTEAVDMWSVGCILAEMLGRKQLFPGKSHMDQIERIIGKLGTPSKDYLKLISSDLITGIILKKGHVKGVAWNEIYPKASKKVVDLLGKMLILDPRKRMTVSQALQHPFLSKYHDPDDEPTCIPVFNFDFERKSLGTHELKKAIIEEIMEYHKPKLKPRLMQFDLRPVPKSELQQALPTKVFNFTPVPKQQLDNKNVIMQLQPKTDNVPPTGLEAFLQYAQPQKGGKGDGYDVKQIGNDALNGQSSSESSEGTKSDGSFERKHSELVQQLWDLHEFQGSSLHNQGEVSEFKKPEGVPLSVKVKDPAKPSDVAPKSSSHDIEMCSAKSTGRNAAYSLLIGAQAELNETSDIEMPSAKSVGQEKSSILAAEPQMPGKQTEAPKQIDTKELLRLAIEQKKNKEEVPRFKPVTALSRQRQREEKRRQKVEKAKERKKKEKKENASLLELTEDDKKLLVKWQNMQKPSTVTAPHTEVNTGRGSPATILAEKVRNTRLQDNNSQRSTQTVGVPGQSTSLTMPIQGTRDQMQGHPIVPLSQEQGQNGVPRQVVSSHGNVEASGILQTNLGASSMQPPHTTSNVLNSFSSVSESQPLPLANDPAPFTSYTPWAESYSENTSTEFGSFAAESNPPGLPTYDEAVQARWANPSTSTTDPNLHSVSSLLPDDQQQDLPYLLGNLIKSSSKDQQDALTVITKQLKQYNMEDLTLTHTPKGTGGGYGVACDLDLYMESAGEENKQDKPDSATLSPTLVNAWQELTGNIDPKEFESVLSDMASPISSQDLNNVMISLMSPRSSKVS